MWFGWNIYSYIYIQLKNCARYFVKRLQHDAVLKSVSASVCIIHYASSNNNSSGGSGGDGCSNSSANGCHIGNGNGSDTHSKLENRTVCKCVAFARVRNMCGILCTKD